VKRNVIVVTTETVDGRPHRTIGMVREAVCISKSAVADVIANVKNWTVGGELSSYSAMLNRSLDELTVRLVRQAAVHEADAIVGFRLMTSHVASGAAELIGYGTAVRFVGEQPMPR
jgi:uncharacterized protein YbjQ (UPF0145 family)